MPHAPDLRLPPQWPDTVKSGVLHAIALAGAAVETVRDANRGPGRLAARLHQAEQDIGLLKEELTIKDERWRRSRTRRRPRTPINRYPDFVRHALRSIKRLVPALVDATIARTLARCGLILSATIPAHGPRTVRTEGRRRHRAAHATPPRRGPR